MLGKSSYLDRVFVDFSIRREDEIASSVVHIVGFGINMILAALLIVFSAINHRSPVEIVSFSVFSILFNLYFIFSILFHSLENIKAKKIFKVLEVASKYLVFIGIAMPLTLAVIGGKVGWIYFSIFLILNLFGLIITYLNKPKSSTFITLINGFLFLALMLFLILNAKLFSSIVILWFAISFVFLLIGLFFQNFGGFRFHHATSHLAYLFICVALFFGFFFGIVV